MTNFNLPKLIAKLYAAANRRVAEGTGHEATKWSPEQANNNLIIGGVLWEIANALEDAGKETE